MQRANPWALLQQADGLRDAKRPKEALELIRRALATDPESYRAHCLAASCLLDLGRPKLALDEAALAARAAPTLGWPRRLRSIAFQKLGEQEEAVEEAEAALALEPESALSFQVLAESQLRAGDRKAAMANARRAVALAPESSSAYMGLSFVAIGCRKWKEAEDAAGRALALSPDSSAAMNNLGVALRHRRRYLLATTLYGSGIRTDPENRLLRANLNRVLLWIGAVVLTTLAWTGVLIGLLVSGSTSGFGTVLTALVLVPCAAALVAMAFGVRRWIGHLTPSMRRVFRDRESWGSVFGDRHMTTGDIFGKILRYAIAPIYVTLAGLFLFLPIVHWAGDSAGTHHSSGVLLAPSNSNSPLAGVRTDEPPKRDDESALFFAGLMMGTFVLVGIGKTRTAQRNNLANPKVEPVAVDWP